MRVSKKQRAFLDAIRAQGEYAPGVPLGLCWDDIPDTVWFSFATESAVKRWIENIRDRGLIRIEKQHFYYLTDLGVAAIS